MEEKEIWKGMERRDKVEWDTWRTPEYERDVEERIWKRKEKGR